MSKKKARDIVTIDFETDPFKYGEKVFPFCAGIYNGENFQYIWGENCADILIKTLDSFPPSVIYAHNGGKFDFHFLLKYFNGAIKLVKGRVLEAKRGNNLFRDSYGILPFPLSAYKKDEFDYSLMVKDKREEHKEDIIKYLKNDCIYLHELVTGFRNEFGDALTIGGASLKELRSICPIENISQSTDEFIRPFYMGGRVQCFETGILTGDFKIPDVNSMYPSVMKNFSHPIGSTYDNNNELTEFTDFMELTCTSKGALPLRDDYGRLTFPHTRARFLCTGHEVRAALDLNLISDMIIHSALTCDERGDFSAFVDKFYDLRVKASEENDLLRKIFYKYILNSAYGKTGQNPENFADYIIDDIDVDHFDKYEPHNAGPEWIVWEKPTSLLTYYNVGVAASITGAARSVLLRGIHAAKRPVYCDTDSLICEEFYGDLDEKRLGAWKIEASGTIVAIAGKKLYSVLDASFDCVKKAHKGLRISAGDILNVANGGHCEYAADAPIFKFGEQIFNKPKLVRRT